MTQERPRRRGARRAADAPVRRTATRARAVRLPASERREHLLGVARKLLATEGPESLRLPRLAEAAGVSKPVVYDHFPTRQALVAALLREYSTYVVEQLAAALAHHLDDEEGALRATTHAYFECVAARGASLARLASLMLADPDMRAAGQRYRDKIFTLFTEHFARMTGLPADAVKLPAAMLVASCEEAIHQWESGAVTREVAEAAQVELILASRTRRDRWLRFLRAHQKEGTS